MAGIIKAGTEIESGSATQQVAFNFDDLNERANSYLAEVRKQARKILEDAKAEGERLKASVFEQAKKEALRDVEKLVQTQVQQQLQPLMPSWENAIQTVVEQRHDWLQKWESGALELVCKIAEKVVRTEIEKKPEIAIELLAEAMQLISGCSVIEILVHEEDLEMLKPQLPILTRGLEKTAQVSVTADARVERGGVLVITDQGEIDQTIRTRLDRIQSELISFV